MLRSRKGIKRDDPRDPKRANKCTHIYLGCSGGTFPLPSQLPLSLWGFGVGIMGNLTPHARQSESTRDTWITLDTWNPLWRNGNLPRPVTLPWEDNWTWRILCSFWWGFEGFAGVVQVPPKAKDSSVFYLTNSALSDTLLKKIATDEMVASYRSRKW